MQRAHGYTIVEILIVVVVIGILAAISLVSYTGIQQNAAAVVLKSDLKQASTQLELDRMQTGSYPSYNSDGNGIPKSNNTTYQYTTSGSTYCLSATSTQPGAQAFHISSTTGTVETGVCAGHSGPGSVIPMVAGGQMFSLALDTDGQLYAWGLNSQGQLGDGTTTQRETPVEIDLVLYK
jgi:prepilin-type N-terminal cleavage/methylation domain-containing protein